MAAFHTLIAEDYNERRYHYEILNPKSEEKPFPKGFLEERVKENLGRSFTAVPTDNGGVYLCWRVLDTDNPNVKFNIYRVYNGKKVKLNRKNITDISGFTDEKPINGEDVTYILEEENNKKKFSHELNVNTNSLVNYTSIKLKDGETARKIAVADLNGDGKYDYIIRTPDINIDPGMPGNMDGTTLKISAYLNDGTYLWTKDLGQGIEPGIWYSPFIAYDFDGDGKAEVALKTAPKDAQRDEKGRIASGDEYLTVLNGMTGEEIATVDWPERNYRYGNLNRQNRNQIGMAYLDGKTPYILAARGTYKLMVVDAWMLHDGKLIKAWRWDGDEENPVVRSQGAHNMVDRKSVV